MLEHEKGFKTKDLDVMFNSRQFSSYSTGALGEKTYHFSVKVFTLLNFFSNQFFPLSNSKSKNGLGWAGSCLTFPDQIRIQRLYQGGWPHPLLSLTRTTFWTQVKSCNLDLDTHVNEGVLHTATHGSRCEQSSLSPIFAHHWDA